MALVAVAAPAGTLGAAAEAQAPPPVAEPISFPLPDDRLLPAVAGFEVQGAAYANAVRALTGAHQDIAEARRVVSTSETRLVELRDERAVLRATVEDRRALLRSMVYDLDGLEIAMRQLAVTAYVRGGRTIEAAEMLDLHGATDTLYARGLEAEVSADNTRKRAALREDIAALHDEIGELTGRLGAAAAEALAAAEAIEVNTRIDAERTAALPRLEATVRDTRITSMVSGTDLPLVALDAYLRAAQRLAGERPQCDLSWTMIAALGRIESFHGHINGATLRPDGRTTVPIIGIALTGRDGTAHIPDTDGGRLDGDPDLDRAVGPMQFIPGTWAMYPRDGNGDGVSDPQNIYDAALAAGSYLCSSGRSLADEANLRAAFFTYNRSTSYVNTGVANVARYRALAFPPVA